MFRKDREKTIQEKEAELVSLKECAEFWQNASSAEVIEHLRKKELKEDLFVESARTPIEEMTQPLTAEAYDAIGDELREIAPSMSAYLKVERLLGKRFVSQANKIALLRKAIGERK